MKNKESYLHDESGSAMDNPYNVSKWMETMNSLYSRANSGEDWANSFAQVTSGWNKEEINHFKRWLSFYQQQSHLKYKTAQLTNKFYLENGGTVTPLDINQLRASLPTPVPDMSSFEVTDTLDKAKEDKEKAESIDKFRRAIIGRINSAKKLLSNPDLQKYLKENKLNVQQLFGTLTGLEGELATVHVRNANSSIFEDLLYKRANQLKRNGLHKEAEMLVSLGQASSAVPNPMGAPVTNPADAAGPGQPIGTNKPSTSAANPPPPPSSPKPPLPPVVPPPPSPSPSVPSVPPVPPSGEAAPKPDSKQPTENKDNEDALIKFRKLMSGIKDVSEDSSSVNDENYSKDSITVYDSDDYDGVIIRRAQAVPAAALPTPNMAPRRQVAPPAHALAPAPTSPVIKIPSGQELATDSEKLKADPFEYALSNIKISDIIARLEAIASMFKNREIARQLSIIDLMMDRAGIASFFPSLAEAMNKSLEANQYCQTRIEDILAKLRGSLQSPIAESFDLAGDDEPEVSESMEEVQKKLEREEKRERAEKERRKELAQADREQAEVEGVRDAAQQLSEPVRIKTEEPKQAPAPMAAPVQSPAKPMAPAIPRQ